MNPQVSQELISAYFDGEVTPEERAAVERLLAKSDDARRELNETAQLSALLHSFPREAAPLELIDNVLRETSLKPLPVQVAPASAPSSRHVWLQVRAALISIATTSAVFLIAIYSTPSPPGGGSMAKNELKRLPATASTDQGPAPESGDRPSEMGVSFGMQAETSTPPAPGPVAAGLAQLPSDQELAQKDSSRDGLVAKPSDNPKLTSDHRKMTSLSAAVSPNDYAESQFNESLELDNFNNPISNTAFVNDLKNGRIIKFEPQVADPESDVPVVDVAVVDIDKGVKEFLILLEKLEIRRRPQSEEREASDKVKRPTEEVVIVFAVAPPDRLANALEELDEHRDLYAGWSKQLPLRIANNDARLKNNDAAAHKPASPKQAPAAETLDRAQSESAEADLAVNALVERSNSIQPNPAEAGPGMNAGGQGGVTAAYARGRNARSADKKEVAKSKTGVEKGDTSTADHVEQGYVFTRRLSVASAQIPPLQSPGLRFQQERVGATDPMRTGGQKSSEAKAPEKGQQQADNRAVRMLFVLHPQIEAARASTKPQ